MIKGIIFDFNRTLFDPEKWALVEGAPEILNKLTGSFQFCLVTTGERKRTEKLKESNLDKMFKKIIFVQGEHKDKKHFLECAQAMGLKPDEVLVVGDKIKAEIRVGNSLGMKTAWFKFGKYSRILPDSKDEEPTYTITKLDELYSVLEKEK